MTLTKALISLMLGSIIVAVISLIIHLNNIHFFDNSSFITSVLTCIAGAVVVLACIYCMKEVWKTTLFVLTLVVLQSCNYAKSNQQVVISTDCGATWEMIEAGHAVPKGVGNYCFMKVVMPNYSMQGDSKFTTNLAGRVRANVHIDYDYNITDPLAFIKQAKFLGKANAHADSEDALDNTAFEGTENMVIDKRIKDVGKGIFIEQDIVELDQQDIENALLTKTNEVLKPLGVQLNFITLTFDLDTETRAAIDVATALKIYENAGIKNEGIGIVVAKAGAPKVTINNQLPAQVVEEE